jgi:uncharacterized protein (TIGR02266 family)
VATRTNRRLSNRIFTRVRLLYGREKPEADGYALNVSAEGMFISATRLHPPGTRLTIRMLPVGAEVIEVAGTVRWGLQVPPRLAAIVKPGMGVLLSSPPKAFVDFFAALAASKIQRSYPRMEVRLEVRYYHRQQFLKDYTENISQGGMFIATAEPFELGAQVRVELMIPDLATQLPLTCRVAYVLRPEDAPAAESMPGIGVEIVEMDPRTDETLRTYLQRIMRLYE